MILTCAVPLPPNFRPGDILAFHRRDPQEVSERVDTQGFAKGMVWEGRPACLSIRFGDGLAHAELAVDDAPDGDAQAFAALVARMLGLGQAVEAFEETYGDHAEIGRLIAQNPGLRLPVAASPFEALSWAITGQQISVGAAVSLRRKLIQAAGIRHSGGLLCYPDAAMLQRLDEGALRQAGFSQAKAGTLKTLADLIQAGALPLDSWLQNMRGQEVADRLLQVRGIGPWTVSYALLRGFGWLDGSLHGDVAVRRSLQSLLGRADKLGEAEARDWLAPFSPWRALVAAHLWAYCAVQA